jgi:hypothetical protein
MPRHTINRRFDMLALEEILNVINLPGVTLGKFNKKRKAFNHAGEKTKLSFDIETGEEVMPNNRQPQIIIHEEQSLDIGGGPQHDGGPEYVIPDDATLAGTIETEEEEVEDCDNYEPEYDDYESEEEAIDEGPRVSPTGRSVSVSIPFQPTYRSTAQHIADSLRSSVRNNERYINSSKQFNTDDALREAGRSRRRLLAAVDRNERLLFVRYEEGAAFRQAQRNHDNIAATYRIRKCPEHIAEKLIDFDQQEDAYENGAKAWQFIKEAGFRLRLM